MGKEFTRTGIVVLLAILMMGLAWYTTPNSTYNPSKEVPANLGEPFFADFIKPEDLEKIKSFEVVAFDENQSQPKSFTVALEDDQWVIPSASGYPAEKSDQVYKSTGGFVGLHRDNFRSSDPANFVDYGVVDPSDEKAVGSKGRGTRIRLFKDSNRKEVLFDLIVGKPEKDDPTKRYVRRPDENEVYVIDGTDIDLSISFRDWVQPKLFNEVDASTVDEMKILDQEVKLINLFQLQPSTPDTINLNKVVNKWEMKNQPKDTITDQDHVRDLVRNLIDLELVGVREKPKGLGQDLQFTGDRAAQNKLAQHGFFFPDGKLISDQGAITFETSDGLQYRIVFGGTEIGNQNDINFKKSKPAGEDVKTVKTSKTSKTSKTTKPDAAKPTAENLNRYVLVSVTFNENQFPKTPKPTEASIAAELAKLEDTKKPDDKKPDDKKPDDKKPDDKKPDDKKPDDKKGDDVKPDDKKTDDSQESPESGEKKPTKNDEDGKKKADDSANDGKKEPSKTGPGKKEPGEKKEPKVDPKDEKVKEALRQAIIRWNEEQRQRNNKIQKGMDEATRLQNRYGDWYYVISEEAFQKIRVRRPDLLKKITPTKPKTEPKKPEPTNEPEPKKPEPKKEPTDKPGAKKTEPEPKKTEPVKQPGRKEKPEPGTEKKSTSEPNTEPSKDEVSK